VCSLIDETNDSKKRNDASIRKLPLFSIAAVFIVLNTGWIANSEMKTTVTEVTISTLFTGVTFLLFLITLANLAVRRFLAAGYALRQPEMMLLYSMLSMSSVVAGVGNMGFFIPFLTNAFWYATPDNGWSKWQYLLPWYVGPRSHAIIEGLYKGKSTFFEWPTIRAWSGPLCVWSIFFLVLLWTTLCLAAIVRRRWDESEHLPFPVLALPLEITKEGAPIYRNRLLWLGFAIPFFLHSLNSLHSLNPLLPSFPINSAKDLLSGAPYPWSSLSFVFGGIHPCGVGFGYLINSDVLFSLWFFYLFRKAVILLGVVEGWRTPNPGVFNDGDEHFPFVEYIGWGAWLALGIAVLWQGRSYYIEYCRSAFRKNAHGEAGEPMPARLALFGFIGGYLFLCAFVWLSGGSFWLPVLLLGIYIALMTALTRLEAEAAVLSPYMVWVNPQSIIATVFGTTNLSRLDTVHLGMLSWFNSDYRAVAFPHQLQAFVGQRRVDGSMKPIAFAIMAAAAFSLLCALLWDLQLYYVNGAESAHVNQWRITMGSVPWNNIQSWFAQPKTPSATAIVCMGLGALITFALSALRNRFPWFVFAPAGFVINTSWANDLFWLDMFIAWCCKTLILRYGGMKSYRQVLPFFLGLILGDFVTGSFWSIIGTIMNQSLFRTFST